MVSDRFVSSNVPDKEEAAKSRAGARKRELIEIKRNLD